MAPSAQVYVVCDVAHHVNHFLLLVKLQAFLRKIAEVDGVADVEMTAVHGFQTEKELEKGGFAGAVVADDAHLLVSGEVVVKGYRPIIKQEHEKTIFNVKHMPNVEALKVMDVMKFAPGVVVTANGGIYVAGKDAAVFVNDRRLSGDELTAYLNSLKASDIERIEVMQNHAGAYDASIQGGVVNIVTKRTMMGFIGSADLYAATPRSGYYELTPTANIFFGTDKWNVYGTYTYTQGRSKQYNETTNDYLYNGTRHYSEGDFFGHTKEHTYRLGAVYNLTPRHSLGLEMNGISTAPVTDNSENTTAYSVGGQTYYGISWQTYKSYSDFYNIVGSYRWDIDSRKSFLRFLINYNNKNSKSDNGLETTYANTSDYNISYANSASNVVYQVVSENGHLNQREAQTTSINGNLIYYRSVGFEYDAGNNQRKVLEGYYLLVYVNSGSYYSFMAQITLALVQAALLAIIIAGVLSFILSYPLISSTRKLSRFAGRIAKGDFEPVTGDIRSKELSELGDTMNRMAHKLEESDVEQKTFFQNASHELRTPLMSIQGYAEGLKFGVFSDQKSQENAIDVIIAETERLSGLVENLLSISKMDMSKSGNYEVKKQNLNVKVLCETIIDRVRGNFIHEDKAIINRINADSLYIYANENDMIRCLENIFSNCLRYCNRAVTFDCRPDSFRRKVTFSIGDDGPGISTEVLEHLFERFSKGKDLRSLEQSPRSTAARLTHTTSLTEAHALKSPFLSSRSATSSP